MKKTMYSRLIATSVLILLLQSCVKDNPYLKGTFRDDKLLLSKVTSTLGTNDINFFFALVNLSNAYQWSSVNPSSGSYDSGKFQTSYSYEKNIKGWEDYNAIDQESFLNTGHYDFSYHVPFPDRVTDNSSPGIDLGYWKFYYDGIRQVQKVGLAFSTATEPVRFEFYQRDWKGQIISFIYGKAVDTPFMNVQYQYDGSGNISNYAIFILKNKFPGVGTSVTNLNSAVSATTKLIKENEKVAFSLPRIQAIQGKNFASRTNTLKAYKQPLTSTFAINPDTSIYTLFLTAKITTDGKTNPYSQQGNIFFYQTNRWYSIWDMDPFFESLLKSNPVKIEYQVPYWTTLWGQQDVSAVQTFSYTYNNWGYPVTVHEEFDDPNFVINGYYTRDSQIEYTKND